MKDKTIILTMALLSGCANYNKIDRGGFNLHLSGKGQCIPVQQMSRKGDPRVFILKQCFDESGLVTWIAEPFTPPPPTPAQIKAMEEDKRRQASEAKAAKEEEAREAIRSKIYAEDMAKNAKIIADREKSK